MVFKQKMIVTAVLVIAAFNAVLGAAYTSPGKRGIILENKSWAFIKQDVAGAQATAFNDASWATVGLPHSFDIPYWRVGSATNPTIGWYRKHITIDASWISAKRVFIEFGAAFLVSQVYVNGTLAGTHQGGYTGFSYDITSLLHSGDNVIAVRVNASWNAQIAPRGGDHNFIGGIYRDVYLVVTDPLHVTWYGTFVSTPQATAASGTVTVKTEIRNNATSTKSCRVVSIVTDSSDNEVTRFESTVSEAAGVLDTFVQTSGTIANPHLWSPQTPYMYNVYTEVYDGTTLVDNFSSPLGFRTVQWNKDNGFSINGQHLWLQGANVHQDHAGWGDATAQTGSFRDVKMIKDCGMNFIRGSHYPHNPAFSDACDKYGICLWEEMCYWTCGGPVSIEPPPNWNANAYPINAGDVAPFEANVKQQLREMIRIHRNHPSVVIWSMGNEVFFTTAATMAAAKNLVSAMSTIAHAEDPTRSTGMGGAQRQGFDVLTDVAGYNGDGATLYMNPGFPSMVAEYGSCKENRPGNYDACWLQVQTTNDSPNQYPWRAGIAIWCGFHHGSNVNLGHEGMIDHARLPLERWYYYRHKYLGIAPPVWPSAGAAAKLKLTTDRTIITDDGTTDCQLIVQVQDASGNWISNQPNITLTDRSGLGLFPGGKSITFNGGATDKGVLNGMAAIEYRSYTTGTANIDATSPGLTPATVTIVVVPGPFTTAIAPSIATLENQLYPMSQIIKSVGNRIAIPQAMRGRNITASVYDLQGRLLFSKAMTGQRFIDLAGKNLAEKVFIVKARTLAGSAASDLK
jgi:hypothetical protein